MSGLWDSVYDPNDTTFKNLALPKNLSDLNIDYARLERDIEERTRPYRVRLTHETLDFVVD